MSGLLVTDTTSPQLVTKPAKAFTLAFDTLKILPFCKHEIDNKGSPIVPGNLKADKRFERKNEVSQYFAHFYALNKPLRERLTGNTIENLNSLLKEISLFSAQSLTKQSFTYIYAHHEFKSAAILTLILEDPLAALSLITASGCGFNSSDEKTKEGALNLLIVISKCAEHSIVESENINQHLINNLTTLSVARNILYKLKEKYEGYETEKLLKEINNEFETMESNAYNHTLYLRKEEIKKEVQKQKEEGQKEQKITIAV